jgi:hypothetical protein
MVDYVSGKLRLAAPCGLIDAEIRLLPTGRSHHRTQPHCRRIDAPNHEGDAQCRFTGSGIPMARS